MCSKELTEQRHHNTLDLFSFLKTFINCFFIEVMFLKRLVFQYVKSECKYRTSSTCTFICVINSVWYPICDSNPVLLIQGLINVVSICGEKALFNATYLMQLTSFYIFMTSLHFHILPGLFVWSRTWYTDTYDFICRILYMHQFNITGRILPCKNLGSFEKSLSWCLYFKYIKRHQPTQ